MSTNRSISPTLFKATNTAALFAEAARAQQQPGYYVCPQCQAIYWNAKPQTGCMVSINHTLRLATATEIAEHFPPAPLAPAPSPGMTQTLDLSPDPAQIAADLNRRICRRCNDNLYDPRTGYVCIDCYRDEMGRWASEQEAAETAEQLARQMEDALPEYSAGSPYNGDSIRRWLEEDR